MGMMTVYHGGYKPVKKPEIRVGRNTKDFGNGFYCTVIKEQAQRWANRWQMIKYTISFQTILMV